MMRSFLAACAALCLSASTHAEEVTPSNPSKPTDSKETPKEAPKPTAPPSKKGKTAEEESGAVPKSLSRNALCAEVKQNAKAMLEAKAKIDAEWAAIEKERTRLQGMLDDIEKARVGLREETARLEAMIAKHDEARQQTGAKRPRPAPVRTPAGKQPPGEMESLAKTVKSMKPEQAAALLSRIDKSLTAEVLKRMRPADAGLVIEKLKPELAAELFAAMASEAQKGSSQ